MARLNLLLLALLTVCALALVTSQDRVRKLFNELEREQTRAQALDVEWNQLQLEASTWAAHSRVAKLAVEKLRMRAPEPRQIQVVELAGSAGPGSGRQ